MIPIDEYGTVNTMKTLIPQIDNSMKTLGELIRMHRQAKNLLIRQVAAELGIDPSLLSRIERDDKKPTRAQVVHLSELLETGKNELLIIYLSDKVVSILRDEGSAMEAILLAQQKLHW